jgi:hypothetical protein
MGIECQERVPVVYGIAEMASHKANFLIKEAKSKTPSHFSTDPLSQCPAIRACTFSSHVQCLKLEEKIEKDISVIQFNQIKNLEV